MDCADKISLIVEREKQQQFLESIQRANMLNFVLEQAESLSVGPPGFLGRMPVPQVAPTTVTGGVTLNKIHIDRSIIGVLNTEQMAEVQQIDINISRLGEHLELDLAEALRALTEAVVSHPTISVEQRSELLDQLHELSHQALLPTAQRKSGIVKAVINGLTSSVNSVSNLATIWST